MILDESEAMWKTLTSLTAPALDDWMRLDVCF